MKMSTRNAFDEQKQNVSLCICVKQNKTKRLSTEESRGIKEDIPSSAFHSLFTHTIDITRLMGLFFCKGFLYTMKTTTVSLCISY